MHKFFYGNVGAKIKGLALGGFLVEAVGAIITGAILMVIGLLDGDEVLLISGFLSSVFGPIVAWVSSWFMYAFGDIADNLRANRENTDCIVNDTNCMVSDIRCKKASPKYTVKENECFSNQYDVSSQKAPYNSQASNSEISYKPSERISNPIIKDPTPTVSSYQASNTSVHNEVTTNKVIDKSPKYCGRCGSVLTSGMCEKCDTVGASSFDEKNTYLIEEEKPVIEESQGELEEKRLEKQERIDAENQRKDSIYLAALTKCNSDDIDVLAQAIANFEFLSDWKDSKDRVKKCRDKMNYLIEKKESGLQERMRTMRRENNLCQYCGGNFKGLFTKVCTQCGSYKDY
jgi:hypothetical protein